MRKRKASYKPKKSKSLSGKPARRSGGNNETSARFKMITERAKKIRQAHPKMKWKNCIRQASQELYK